MAYQFPDNDEFIDYLLGDISPEKRSRVEQELANNCEDLQLISDIQRVQRLKNARARYELAGEVKQIRRNISEMIEGESSSDKSVDRRKLSTRLPSLTVNRPAITRIFSQHWTALAVTVATIALFTVYNSSFILNEQSVSVYATLKGERARVTLPDGSRVFLNVGTTLQVPTDYGYKTRTVTLSGEAVFEVEETSKVPFLVKAGNSITKVLGTKFVIRHYDTDSVALVSVSSGKVSVTSDKYDKESDRSIVISVNETIEVSHNGSVIRRAAIKNYASFEAGVMLISPKPLSEAMADLNRWYNADIRLGDAEVGKTIISGEFPSGSITDFVEQLTTGLKVDVVRNDRILTLHSSKP